MDRANSPTNTNPSSVTTLSIFNGINKSGDRANRTTIDRSSMAVRHNKETLDSFSKLLDHRESSDVVFIVAEDKRVHAHRCVLAVRSQAFQAMLFGSMKEAQTKEVKIADSRISLESFRAFLAYVYTGSTEIGPSTVFGLFHLSRMYDFPALLTSCEEYCHRAICSENCLEVLKQAYTFQEEKVMEVALKVICDEAKDVLAQSQFLQIPRELVLLLVREELAMDELDLFLQLVRWYKHNSEKQHQRDSPQKEIFKHVRYACIPSKELVAHVRPTGLAPLELYLAALEFQANPESMKHEVEEEFAKPRMRRSPPVPCEPMQDVLVVSASSEDRKYVKERTLNGNIAEYWLSQHGTTKDQWLVYDFRDFKWFRKLRLCFARFSCRVKDFTLQCSDDQVSWAEVKSFSTQKYGTDWQDFEGFAVHTRYVRLFLLNTHGTEDGEYMLVSCVQFWGNNGLV